MNLQPQPPTMPSPRGGHDPEEELDIALAAELQCALLPTAGPALAGLERLAARNRMCGSVGGDFFDFLRINSEQSAVVIGDVVGHGIRAALLMARIMGLLRSDGHIRSRPRKLIVSLNRMLLDLGDRLGSVLPCSVFYAVIDGPSGMAFFINAGHPQPILCERTSRNTDLLGPRNMLLGVEDFEPREGCHTFLPGERLVLYTDGIVEAANGLDELFGLNRLHQTIADSGAGDGDECASAIFQSVDAFRQDARQMDDETIVVVDRA